VFVDCHIPWTKTKFAKKKVFSVTDPTVLEHYALPNSMEKVPPVDSEKKQNLKTSCLNLPSSN